VTASAIASALKARAGGGPVDVRARGGRLKVDFEIRGDLVTDIWLTGPATFVFAGSVEA
jgi:diaminopimelate epimerase